MSVRIIAEAGVNHNGDLAIAKQLVDAAARAGADVVKFQTFVADRLVLRTAGKAGYQTDTTDPEESQHEMLRQLELTPEMHDALVAHCEHRSIRFLSTAFDEKSVDLLVSLGQTEFKIPSGEITNLPYLRHVARLRKPILLSTGMATLGEIEEAIEILEQAGTPRSLITVLHCTTEYPAPLGEVNLRAMRTIGDTFGVAVGYSDHTSGIEVAIAAVALGASVLEKHFTLDRSLPGPDHRASLEPGELTALVAAVRKVEQALGDGIKRVGTCEARNRAVARKSLVAAKPIRAGEPFTAENITAKRPGTGISPIRWEEVLRRTATRDFAVDELIEP